jgi:hypothetical protein
MTNPMQVWNGWLALSWQAARLGFEAQSVIALRMLRLAGGGARGRAEAQRMVTEKAAAMVEAQAAATAAAITGGQGRRIASKAVQVYKRRVRQNRRRLTRHR